MAKTVDELIVEIKADTRDLNAKLNNIQGTLGKTGQAGRGAFVPMIGSLRSLIPLLGGAAAALGGISAFRGIAQVGSEFEDLRDSLNTVFGSINAGKGAFDRILTFSQTTPFQIEDVSRAFIQLKGAGIEPSMDMLQTFADTASTSVDQLGAFQAMVRLVSRSAAGGLGLEEINQLDDRGIPATKILTEALGVTRLELGEFGKTAQGAAQMVQLLISGMQERFGGAMEQKMDNLSTKTSNMTIAFKELGNAIFESGLADGLKTLVDRITSLTTATARFVRLSTNTFTGADLAGTDSSSAQRLDALAIKMREQETKLRDNSTGFFDTEKKRRKRAEALSEIERLDEIMFGLEQAMFAEAEAPLIEKFGAIGDAASSVKQPITELNQVMEEAAQNLARDFANALLSGENALKSFGDFTKSIIAEIIASFLRMQVITPILQGLFPNMQFGTQTPMMAGGGRASHGRAMVVGERGPELFVPHSAGNIINAADTRSAMSGGGGVSVVQNISFSTGVVPTVRAEVTRMLPQIADVSKAAVLEANMRGGSFKRGMR